jgi:general secretion pathway protein D
MKTFWISRAILFLGLSNITYSAFAQEGAPDLPPADTGLSEEATPDEVIDPAKTAPSVPPAGGGAGDLTKKGASKIPPGQELVNMDFPELTDIKDIIKAVSLWTGKNVILDRNVNGKVQIISPEKVTKEEAYQAFLSALNILGLTTVETGKIIKILPVRTAVKGNLRTFLGSTWTPRTDEIITQIVPLKYIDAKKIQGTLSRIVTSNAMIAYEPTNTLIISDSGYKVRRVLDILELLDVQGQQPQVAIVPIKYSDAKSIADKVSQILQASNEAKSKGSYLSYKVITDERSNSVIVFGPPRTIKDIRALVKKFDIQLEDATRQASIHVRPLDYADAKKLASTLSALASGGAQKNNLRPPPVSMPASTAPKNSKVGIGSGATSAPPDLADLGDGVKITADESSNALLITGSRAAYEAVNSIIRKLDIRRSQVFVEADILDLGTTNNFKFDTSIFAGYGSPNGTGTKTVTAWEGGPMGPLVVAGSGAAAGGAAGAAASAAAGKEVASVFASDMTIGVLSGAKVAIPGLGTFSPGALIKMLKTDANTKVLSSPHILTSNNEEALITVGEKIFFQSAETSPTGITIPKVEKEDAELSLNIKPNISNSNYVTLKIDIEASSVGTIDPVTRLPSINKRQTKQIVTAKNGQTIVISGLVSHTQRETFKKIPLLGDIPIIGWLFRNSAIDNAESNLVIFLTPHVIHGADDLAAIYKTKVSERDEFLSTVYGSAGKEGRFYSRLPTQDDGLYRPTPMDEAEQRRLDILRDETYREMGYIDGEQAPAEQPGPLVKESVISVPVAPPEDAGLAPEPVPVPEAGDQ